MECVSNNGPGAMAYTNLGDQCEGMHTFMKVTRYALLLIFPRRRYLNTIIPKLTRAYKKDLEF